MIESQYFDLEMLSECCENDPSYEAAVEAMLKSIANDGLFHSGIVLI